MIILDTDHLSVLSYPAGDRRARLVARMALEPVQRFGATVVSYEERSRGWLAAVAKERDVARQVAPYREFGELPAFFRSFILVPFDDAAAAEFKRQRAAKMPIPTMDLKIAAIALIRGALLLTANRRDFEKVPGLRFENWLDPPPT